MKPGKRYRNMVWVVRVNGPLLCILAMASAGAAFDEQQGSASLRVGGFLVSALLFVGAAFWTRQCWKEKLS